MPSYEITGEIYPATTESDTYEPPEHEAELRRLLGRTFEPMQVAGIVYAHRIYEAEFVVYLQKTRGNQFVAQMQPFLDWLRKENAPVDADHSAGVQGRGYLAKDAVETTTDKTAPAAADALPYDGAGGWDAITINTRLGQGDSIKETNSDGDRCAFATALAAQIFAGPQAVATWSTAFVAQHTDKNSSGRPGAAKGVVEKVNAAITSGAATYGDLQWMQEALHDVALSQDHAGTKTSFEVIAPEVETYTDLADKKCTTDAEVRAAAATLQPGERMMVEWHAERLFGADIDHQLMLYNDAGLVYLYDPQPFKDGVHLLELGAVGLGYYFNGKEYSKSVLKMAGKVAPKK